MEKFDAQYAAYEVAIKTEGIAHLLYCYRPEGHGKRDREAIHGIALILEDLAKKGHELSEKLDCINMKKTV